MNSWTLLSRRILGRLRDVMAGGGLAQERLDRVVTLISQDLVADVCSCYVMRPGEVLELFATQGLKKTAVHHTRLRVGEGLVGDIAAHARHVAISDAQNHPNFVYRPETGEEIYHSLLGVPILRGGRVIGVLVIQNKTFRQYTEEEVETLETVAMVLAELVTSGELIPRDEMVQADGNALLPLRLEGMRLNAGIGIGKAVLHQPRLTIRRLVAEDPRLELERLCDAVGRMHSALDEMLSSSDLAGSGEHQDILETYRMFAQDAGWLGKITEAVRGGLTAEAAVQKVGDDTRARMATISDPYLRERMHDLEDVSNRLLMHLSGGMRTAANEDLPDDVVLVARSMGPAELLDYDRKKLRGIILEEGSPTMHVTIIAKALDIPVVGRVREVLSRIEPLDPVVVDGSSGLVFLRPPDEIIDGYRALIKARADRMELYAATERDKPAVTKDGARVNLLLNAGLIADMAHLPETNADGVGLFRTEIPFLTRSDMPDVEVQTRIYRSIMEQSEGKPVVFRTLDVGGDKVVPYWNSGEEENPAMGWRSIRITLDRPALLRQQVRALIRASAGMNLSVMFPMIAEVGEFIAAREILDAELAREKALGHELPLAIKVGTMLEVPALALQLESLLPLIDFISIGSNDLTQFMFAADRGNPRLSERYDPISPPMLSFFKDILKKCEAHGVTCSVCGEIAGRPFEAMTLIGLGFRHLSMPAPSLPAVKAMIMTLEAGKLGAMLDYLLAGSYRSIRTELKGFAVDNGIFLS
jgi:phosphotransferase system enzyme I (PtsP)